MGLLNLYIINFFLSNFDLYENLLIKIFLGYSQLYDTIKFIRYYCIYTTLLYLSDTIRFI